MQPVLVGIDAGKYIGTRTEYELYPEKEKTWGTSIVKNQNRNINKIVHVHLNSYVQLLYINQREIRHRCLTPIDMIENTRQANTRL